MWQNRNVHVFIDEFCGSYIDKNEVFKLQEVLKLFTNCHIVVAVQSMEEVVSIKNTEESVDVGYQFDLLKENTSFVFYNLEHSLRSSFEINEFVKETVRIIELSATIHGFVLQNYHSSSKFVDKEFGLENYVKQNKRCIGNMAKVSLKYKYNQSDVSGHKVKGGPVNVYFVNKCKVSKLKNGKLRVYMSVLSYILNNNENKYVVCTYDKELYNTAFSFLRNYECTNEINKFIKPKAKFRVLLTDYASVRGFEFPNFVFMAPLGSNYLKYRIVECLSRATTNLFVITDNWKIYQKWFLKKDSTFYTELLNIWKHFPFYNFYEITYDKCIDRITVVENEELVTLKTDVSKIDIEICDRFPWSQGVSVQCGSKENDENDGILAVMRNLFASDNIQLCKAFLDSNDISFNFYDDLWKAKLLVIAIEQNALKILHLLFYEHNFEVDRKEESYPSLLKTAWKCKNHDAIEILLNRFIKVNRVMKYVRLSSILSEIKREVFAGGSWILIKKDKSISPLFEAVCDGYFDLASFFIERCADISWEDNDFDFNTPLHVASSKGFFNIVKMIIAHGGNIHCVNKHKETPLHTAACKGHIEIVKTLLEHDASVYIQNIEVEGDTPLHNAACKGHIEIVKTLLDYGASVYIQNKVGDTPLHAAASNGHVDVVKIIIDKETPLKDKYHRTEKCNGYVEVMSIMDRRQYVNSQNKSGHAALHVAVSKGYSSVVVKIIEQGANINLRTLYGNTPLHYASLFGHVDIVKMLINKNVNISVNNNEGITALHNAAFDGHIEIVKLLLENGAMVNQKGRNGRNPLCVLSENSCINIVKLMTDEDIGVDVKEVVLHYCFIFDKEEIWKCLLKQKRIFNDTNLHGNNLFHYTLINKHNVLANFLIEKGANLNKENKVGNTPLHLAIKHFSDYTVKLLIDKGAKVNIKNIYGLSPFHYAVIFDHINIVKLLLMKGVNIDEKDEYGNSPLHHAVACDNFNIARFLIERHALVNIQNNSGNTPLHNAVNYKLKSEIRFIELLIAAGADVKIQNHAGNTLVGLMANKDPGIAIHDV